MIKRNRLKEILKERNISQADVVRGTGITRQYLSECCENRSSISDKWCNAIADFLGISPSEINVGYLANGYYKGIKGEDLKMRFSSMISLVAFINQLIIIGKCKATDPNYMVVVKDVLKRWNIPLAQCYVSMLVLGNTIIVTLYRDAKCTKILTTIELEKIEKEEQ